MYTDKQKQNFSFNFSTVSCKQIVLNVEFVKIRASAASMAFLCYSMGMRIYPGKEGVFSGVTGQSL